MNIFNLYSQILGRPWAIDYREAIYNTPLIAKVIDDHSLMEAFFKQFNERQPDIFAKTSSFLKKAKADKFVDYPGILRNKDTNIVEGSTAVIPVMGTLMKNGDFCSYGMNNIIEWINDAESKEEITDIIFLMDTPGGTVDGTMKLGDRIKAISKPNVAVIDGLCCSGGMWIASNTDKIIALNETCEIGSIGVALYFADIRKMYEEMGVTFHDINSTLSKDKNKEYFDALEGKYETVRNESLDPLAKLFINQILKNRPQTSETQAEWNTAKVFFAKKAKELGLIDEIGDANIALEALREIKETKSIKSKTPVNMTNKYPNIMSALSLDDIEGASEEGVFINASLLDTLENAIKEKNDEAASSKEELSAKAEEIKGLQNTISEKETEVENLNANLTTAKGEKETLENENLELKKENAELKDEDSGDAGGADVEDDFGKGGEESSDDEADAIYQTGKRIKESRLK